MYSSFDTISFPCTFVRSFTAFPSTQLNALLLRRNKLRACKVGNACYTYIRFLTLFTFLGMCIFPSSILLKECDIWYSALVHKSSVRAFLLITFNLLKKTILSCKLSFVYSLEFWFSDNMITSNLKPSNTFPICGISLYKISRPYYDGDFSCVHYLNCG